MIVVVGGGGGGGGVGVADVVVVAAAAAATVAASAAVGAVFALIVAVVLLLLLWHPHAAEELREDLADVDLVVDEDRHQHLQSRNPACRFVVPHAKDGDHVVLDRRVLVDFGRPRRLEVREICSTIPLEHRLPTPCADMQGVLLT